MRTQLLDPYHAHSLLFVLTVCSHEVVWNLNLLIIIFSYISIFIKKSISVCLHY